MCSEKKEYVLSKQILRSGTSIGANLFEGEVSITKKEFQAKLYIALKECNETLYWLRLLYRTDYLNKSMFQSIYDDCFELKKLLQSSTKTIGYALNKHRDKKEDNRGKGIDGL